MEESSRDELVREIERLNARLNDAISESGGGGEPFDRERFSKVLSHITDGVYVYDRDLRIIYANGAAAAFTGSTVDELLHRRPLDIYPSMEDTDFYKAYLRVIDTGRPEVVEAPFDFPDGRSRWYEVHIYPLPDGLLAIARDVTERVRRDEERTRIQAQILQAQKLESLGVLAGGIAHDFNNLLMSVLGYANLALSDMPAESSAYESIRQVELAARRAADLCKQMLAYSGRGHFVVQAVDLTRLVEEMSHLLTLAKSKNATLKYSLASSLPRIDADATQLHQVLINLVTNASDAIGCNNGVISVTTGVIDCDEAYLDDLYIDEPLRPGRYVFLEVSDDGCGIDKDVRPKVFEPFFTTKFTGRGLGLAAVLGIVRGHHGAVKLYSETGRGTTVKVLLPVNEGVPQGALSQGTVEKMWAGQGTILIVDDEESVRNVTRAALRRVGFKTLEACDGQEALELLAANQQEVRLVLLDVTMPRMGGEETYRKIRQLSIDIPVILSSGYNEEDATGHFNGKGLSGFIQKPYRPTDLIARIRSLLGESESP